MSKQRFWNSRVPALMIGSGLVATALALAPALSAPAAPAALATAANAVIASLDAGQKKLALFPFDAPSRTVWYYIPIDRDGVVWKTLSAPQQKLVRSLLQTALSAEGDKKTQLIMSLESVLAEIEKDPVKRDPGKYYLSIFGTPSDKADANWGFRFEGHHVSLNFTIAGGNLIATSPNFFGANPAEVRQGKMKGTRALAAEEDVARELVTTFTGDARKQVVYDTAAPDEILTKNDTEVKALDDKGVTIGKMTKPQRDLALKLIGVHTAFMAPTLAADRKARFEKAGVDKIKFAWAGGLARGDRHYYRLQGPTFLVEYDNTQNDANHVHVVWRDFKGDFGRDLLREHIAAVHTAPVAAPTAAATTPSAQNDCKVAKDPTTEIGKACQEGGIKKAKTVMKALTKAARKAGFKKDCDDCHKDEDNWELNKDARDVFKELAKAAGTK